MAAWMPPFDLGMNRRMVNRILLGINCALVVAVVLLSFATLSIDRKLSSLPGGTDSAERTAAEAPEIDSFQLDSGESQPVLDPKLVAELRRLIRDELRAGASIAADAAVFAANSQNSAEQAFDDLQLTETDWQSALVDQELDFYITRGAISPAEMSALQSEIAKLGPKGQADAMRRLVGAMNAGELDGRL